LPETLAIVMKWREVPTPMSEEDFRTALQELTAAVELLDGKDDAMSASVCSMAYMVLGNIHRDHGFLEEALPLYDDALKYPESLDDGTPRGKNELANVVMNRGICLLSIGDAERFPLALADFDQAIELRKDLPFEEDPMFRWGLSASWMNRGDVLNRMGDRKEEALAAYDQALEHLKQLPNQENPAFVQRLALAWANRGLVVEDQVEARKCFDECISLLSAPQDPQQLLTLCNALLNRGRHSLQIAGDPEATAADARSVVELLTPHERNHPSPAEMALQARHLLAHALCTWLDGSKKGPGIAEDWIGDATDTVEDALSVERHWEQQGLTAFRPLASDLFELGLHVYRVCQPHFLAEFLIESLDPEQSPGAPFDDPRFQGAAARALRQGLNEAAERAASTTLEPERQEKQIAIIQSLKAADERLAQLQQAQIPAPEPEAEPV
jgi:tetratricopeptide (TPR) repeat protein